MATQYPETRVLIIMTGGTICMKISPEGLVPARGFLESGMAPRPSFNDGSSPGEYLFPTFDFGKECVVLSLHVLDIFGSQTRRKQSFLLICPRTSQFIMHVYSILFFRRRKSLF